MASGAPNFLKAIEFFEAGRNRAEKSRLQQLDEQARTLTGQALGGDANAERELAGVNPQAYINVKNFKQQQKAQRLDELAAGAMAADTPEKWNAFVQRAEAQGHKLGPGETRQTILDQAMGWKEKLAQSNNDRSFNLQKTNADRSYSLQRDELTETKRYHDASLAAKDQTSDLQEYNFALQQGFKGSFLDYKNALKNANQLSVTLPDGTVINQGPGKPLTEAQSKDTVFATRAQGALPKIDEFGNALTSLGENVGGRAPIVGNYMKSPQYQQAEQAGREFLQAILRKDTGAAITKEETAEYGSVYLPQPGDGAAVLEQKRVSRLRALEAIKAGLPASAILAMEKAGAAVGAGKGDNQQPRIRTYNPDTGELE